MSFVLMNNSKQKHMFLQGIIAQIELQGGKYNKDETQDLKKHQFI